jgi:hypothetical protein
MRPARGLAAPVALLLLALAAGCASPPLPQAPTPSPTVEEPILRDTPVAVTPMAPTATVPVAPTTEGVAPPPTQAPPTQAPPSPTAPTAQGQLLPAPLYAVDAVERQVFRVGRDGRDAAQVTFEAQPVLELAAAPAAGRIAYVVGDAEGADRMLVVLDGAGRRELLAGNVSGLAISPDGQRLVYRLDDPPPGLIVGQSDSPPGVWQSLAEGPGRPSLVIADAPADGTYDDADPAWTYDPVGFSPDGARLALTAFDADGPGIPGGELVILGPGPDDRVGGMTCCEQPEWSADGRALLAAGGGPGPDVRYGLFRTDVRTGAEADLLAAAPADRVPLVTFPYQAADGRVYALAELAPADGFSWDYPFRPRLVRVEGDDTLTPLSEPLPWPAAALWAQDGSGVVVAEQGPEPRRALWVALDGATAVLPAGGTAFAWGPVAAELAAGSCGAFAPISYQAPAARAFSPAARDVQARLAALGLPVGAPDGLYGEQTRAAVEAFQRERGLSPTGDVDCATWQALLAGPRP